MASKRALARKKKSDLTLAMDPVALRKKADEAQMRRLEREDVQRRAERQPDGFGVNEAAVAGVRGKSGEMIVEPLASMADVEVRRDHRGRIKSAWRSNPFRLLTDSGSLGQDEANAAHDLMSIYAASKGLDGGPEQPMVVVDGGNPNAWGAEDRRQYHIRLYGLIIDSLSAKSAKLAKAFAFAVVEEDRPMAWRGIVERETGSENKMQQTTRVQVMCEELVDRIPKCREALRDMINERRVA